MDNLTQAFNTILQVIVGVHINQYLYVFAIFFLLSLILSRFSSFFRRFYFSFESTIIKFLKNRELFYIEDSSREEIWLNLIRIIAGYTLVSRSFWVFYYEIALHGSLSRSIIAFGDLVSSFFTMIGFFTPIFTGMLFLFHTYLNDTYLNIYTLGSCAAQIILLILMFIPVGRRLSIDALFIAGNSFVGRLIKGIYSFIGMPTSNRIAMVKFCAFISYGLLCMYSVYGHIKDPYWASGIANVMLLSSNWLTSPYELFRHLFSEYGKTAILISMIALYTMMLWELAIIPFTLIKGLPRLFVIFWGLAFFTVSRFVLQLSWLPHYQFILFAVFFWPGWLLNQNGKSSLEVYYDDQCNLCDWTIRLVMMVDWFSVIQLRPLSKNEELIQKRGLTSQQVYDDLYGYDAHNNRMYKGYDLYVGLTAKILPLAIFFPLLYAGKLLRIGQPIYKFIAKRRRQIFGVCEIPKVDLKAAQKRESVVSVKSQYSTFFTAFLGTYVAFLFVYLITFPYLDRLPGIETIRKPFSFIGPTPPALNGQIPILVFTPDVISMGRHYFTVTGVFKDGTKQLLPYVGKDGERLALVKGSDRLYFGHALIWRRKMYGKSNERICYNSKRDDKLLIDLFHLADNMWDKKPDHYQIDYYHQSLPDPDAARKFVYRLSSKEHVCTVIAHHNKEWTIVS